MKKFSETERQFTYKGVTFDVIKQRKVTHLGVGQRWEVYAYAINENGARVSNGFFQSQPEVLGAGWFVAIGSETYAENFPSFRAAVRRVAELCAVPVIVTPEPRRFRFTINQSGGGCLGIFGGDSDREAFQKYAQEYRFSGIKQTAPGEFRAARENETPRVFTVSLYD